MSNHIVIRYKNKKKVLEILCDQRYLKDYQQLQTNDARKVRLSKFLITDTIFSNYKKGNIARKSDVYSITGTTNDTDAILFIIIKHGRIPSSRDERRQLVDQKRAAIIHYFVSNFLNPANNKPHPAERIDAALKEIKGLVIDPHIPTEIQATQIFKNLIYKIPLKKNHGHTPPSSKDSSPSRPRQRESKKRKSKQRKSKHSRSDF